jgi:FHA domain
MRTHRTPTPESVKATHSMMDADTLPAEMAEDATIPRATGSAWALLVVGEGVAAINLLPRDGEVSVGRGREAGVSVRHPSLSRRHALLRVGSFITIEDLGSRHGTALAGRRLLPGKAREVRPGDVVTLGTVSVTLVRTRSATA